MAVGTGSRRGTALLHHYFHEASVRGEGVDSELVHHCYPTRPCIKELSLLCMGACRWLRTPTAAEDRDSDSGCCHYKPAGPCLFSNSGSGLETSAPCSLGLSVEKQLVLFKSSKTERLGEGRFMEDTAALQPTLAAASVTLCCIPLPSLGPAWGLREEELQ